MTAQDKLEEPRHVQLSRFRVTPEHLANFQEALQKLVWDHHAAVQHVADNKVNLLREIYNDGFSDGYAAALLEQDRNGQQ